jgi:hypothetical protein
VRVAPFLAHPYIRYTPVKLTHSLPRALLILYQYVLAHTLLRGLVVHFSEQSDPDVESSATPLVRIPSRPRGFVIRSAKRLVRNKRARWLLGIIQPTFE